MSNIIALDGEEAENEQTAEATLPAEVISPAEATSPTETEAEEEDILSYDGLIETSKKFMALKKGLRDAVRLSLTGITNLVVGYEDPCLVDTFLKDCFEDDELYKKTYDIDAVELQRGLPGRGMAAQYLDALIFGNIKEEEEEDNNKSVLNDKTPAVNVLTGAREREPDGFVNRPEVILGEFKDRLLIIKNLDYCLDFCQQVLGEKPGKVDARNLWIFDKFRNPSIKMGCRILLVTNERLRFPFKVRVLKIDPVDSYEANHIIDSFLQLYEKNEYIVNLTDSQKQQIARKLTGLTYTEASDAFAEASNRGETDIGTKEIDSLKMMRFLRQKINKNLMEDAVGLNVLTPKPWADYICPESSNFTYDVKKIVRDFEEIDFLKREQEKCRLNNADDSKVQQNMDAIRARMPHIIILYGKGGVGKSAFPVHFAGLLDFDAWDFNVNASHSKWVGEGSEKMRNALAKISKASHLVVRIDEYDRAMGAGGSSGQDMHYAHKQVESEFMNWLQNGQEDGLFVKNDIFVVLTTNHKDNITGPLLRSGRADLVMDISDFDDKSMRETFLSAPRRMKNRGLVPPVGFDSFEDFSTAIEKLDLGKLVPLVASRGFTVRDIDTILVEMAAHSYYHKKNKNGIPWTTEMFEKVLEKSSGSTKNDDTCELVVGDRFLLEEQKGKEATDQLDFPFLKDYTVKFDMDQFVKNIPPLK